MRKSTNSICAKGNSKAHPERPDYLANFNKYADRIKQSDADFLTKVPGLIASAQTLQKLILERMPGRMSDTDRELQTEFEATKARPEVLAGKTAATESADYLRNLGDRYSKAAVNGP